MALTIRPTNPCDVKTIVQILIPNANNGEYFGAYYPDISRVVMIDQLDFWPTGDHIFIDDFTYSVEAVLPEPGTMGLVSIGFVSLMRRRKQTGLVA